MPSTEIRRCIACRDWPTDRAHIKSKGAGGSMEDHNLVNLCRTHHREQHQHGWSLFLDRHPAVWIELQRKGWEMKEVFGIKKLFHKGEPE